MLKAAIRTLVLALVWAADETSAAGVVVIGHPNLKRLDATTVAKIFTGKIIEGDGIPVIAINANSGSAVRNRFLHVHLNQDEDKYTGILDRAALHRKSRFPKSVAAQHRRDPRM